MMEPGGAIAPPVATPLDVKLSYSSIHPTIRLGLTETQELAMCGSAYYHSTDSVTLLAFFPLLRWSAITHYYQFVISLCIFMPTSFGNLPCFLDDTIFKANLHAIYAWV